jgi:hypothetical protein
MKIECPSCHLAGKANELEFPPEGRNFDCPRCKNSFHVARPVDTGGNKSLMNICPACQYSTFTEEMFVVCPKCGLTADGYQEKTRKEREIEQERRDQEVLHRSYRNADLVKGPTEDDVPGQAKAGQPVRLTGWLCIAVGVALLCYGLAGLANYYSKDWQAQLSETHLEPVSKISVFFTLGFLPWLLTLFSVSLIGAASQFLMLRNWARTGLVGCAWAGLAVAVIYETASFINWARVSSSTPSLSFYAVGVISSLFMMALWSAPFCALLWYLKSDVIIREFPEGRNL